MDLKEITEQTQREIAQLKESHEKAERAVEVSELDHLIEQKELKGLIDRREMEVAKEKNWLRRWIRSWTIRMMC